MHPSGDVNTIDYVEIATLGDALDFGDTTAVENNVTAAASPTRGFCFGLSPTGALGGIRVNMITFSSKGDAIDFGDGSFGFVRCAAGSNNVRALIAGRQGPSSAYRGEMIQVFNMTSGGNAESFGELEIHPFIPSNTDHPKLVRFEKGAEVGGYENSWHHDVTWREAPSKIAVLRAVSVPSTGGDTMFSDMCAAYEGLDDSIKFYGNCDYSRYLQKITSNK